MIADPILFRHRLPQRVSLLTEFPDRGPLLGELVEPILHRLAVDTISAVRIHRAESRALDSGANQLGNQRLPGRAAAVSPAQIHRDLQGRLPGGFIAGLLIGIGQIKNLPAQFFYLYQLREQQV